MPTISFDEVAFTLAQSDLSVLRVLIRMGFKPDLMKDPRRNTLLSVAAGLGAVSAMRLLVDSGANIEQRNAKGETPLWCAAEKGQSDSINFLIDEGAEFDATNELGVSPFVAAAKGGHFLTAAFLMAYGADISRVDRDGYSALYFAARFDHVRFAMALMSAGCRWEPVADNVDADRELNSLNGLCPFHTDPGVRLNPQLL